MTRLSPLASGKSPGSLSFPLYIMCDDPEAWPVRPAGSLPRTGAGLGRGPSTVGIHLHPAPEVEVCPFFLVGSRAHPQCYINPTPF